MNNLRVLALAVSILHGCAAPVSEKPVTVETKPSDQVRVVDVTVSQLDDKLLVTGKVVRLVRIVPRGRLHIDVVNAEGDVVASADAAFIFRRSGATVSRMAPFSAVLDAAPSQATLVFEHRGR